MESMGLAYHPQLNRQVEISNREIKIYIGENIKYKQERLVNNKVR